MSAELAALRAAVLAAFPGLVEPRLVQCRVVREVAGRLSLQPVASTDDAPDANPVEVWPGIPGVTSSPTPGELVVVAFVGVDQYPVVVARSPEGGPGHTPAVVRLDATTEIRALGGSASSAAVMKVGSAPAPLAKAASVDAMLAALKVFASSASAAVNVGQVAAAAATLLTSLNLVASVPTTKLEAT